MRYFLILLSVVICMPAGGQQLTGHCYQEQFRLDQDYPNEKTHLAAVAYIWTDEEGATRVGSWDKVPLKYRPHR